MSIRAGSHALDCRNISNLKHVAKILSETSCCPLLHQAPCPETLDRTLTSRKPPRSFAGGRGGSQGGQEGFRDGRGQGSLTVISDDDASDNGDDCGDRADDPESARGGET